jgi:hypothetical protein
MPKPSTAGAQAAPARTSGRMSPRTARPKNSTRRRPADMPEPGSVPKPGTLLDWRDARHSHWGDEPCVLCGKQAGEQYVAETGRSTPTVQDAPHSGQLAVRPAFTASILTRARRIRRQCRERQADEQKTVAAFAAGISGPPHPRHNRGPASFSATTTSRSRGSPSLPMRPPYDPGHRLDLRSVIAVRPLALARNRAALRISDQPSAAAVAAPTRKNRGSGVPVPAGAGRAPDAECS